MKKYLFSVISLALLMLIISCNNSNTEKADSADAFVYNPKMENLINSIAAHDERDTIVGKFDGVHIDTIMVIEDLSECYEIDPETGQEHTGDLNKIKYFAQSNNPKIPTIELYGCRWASPKLVFEGDLDGNGTDEWGYLVTGENSTWRQYYVFALKNNKWVHLIKDNNLLDTTEEIRGSGYEILEPGDKPGWVKVNYIAKPFRNDIVRDTLVKATYIPVNSKTY